MNTRITAQELFEQQKEKLALRWLAGHTGGQRDLEAGLPVEDDTVFRIYSMTKPITAVAAMILYEEGRFELNDPVAKFLPEFANPRVLTGGTALKPVTRPAATPMRGSRAAICAAMRWRR